MLAPKTSLILDQVTARAAPFSIKKSGGARKEQEVHLHDMLWIINEVDHAPEDVP